MLTLIKRIFRFRLSQTAARRAVRALGFGGGIAGVAGLIAGYRALRRH